MTQYLKKAKSEIGLSPTELVFRGQKKVDQIQMGIIDFDETSVEEKAIHSIKEITPYAQRKTVTWFNIYGLHDIELLQEIGEEFNFEKAIEVVEKVMERRKLTLSSEMKNVLQKIYTDRKS